MLNVLFYFLYIKAHVFSTQKLLLLYRVRVVNTSDFSLSSLLDIEMWSV